jgi:hypothetical protein
VCHDRSCENVVVSGEGLPRGTVTSRIRRSLCGFGNDVFAAIRATIADSFAPPLRNMEDTRSIRG